MPYKLSTAGDRAIKLVHEGTLDNMTDLQQKALQYLYEHRTENRFIDAAEIAHYYSYPNGQYFRGVLASLHSYKLLDKKED
jgi:hypothetical protein